MTIAKDQVWQRKVPKDGEPSRVVIGTVFGKYVLFTQGGSVHRDTLEREYEMVKEGEEEC